MPNRTTRTKWAPQFTAMTPLSMALQVTPRLVRFPNPYCLQAFRGTWERRKQLIKITLIRLLSINFTSCPPPPPTPPQTVPRVTQTTQDTSQSSARHPTGTLKQGLNSQFRVIARKGTNQSKQYSFTQCSFNGVSPIDLA